MIANKSVYLIETGKVKHIIRIRMRRKSCKFRTHLLNIPVQPDFGLSRSQIYPSIDSSLDWFLRLDIWSLIWLFCLGRNSCQVTTFPGCPILSCRMNSDTVLSLISILISYIHLFYSHPKQPRSLEPISLVPASQQRGQCD